MAELTLAGFTEADLGLGWQFVLWEDLPHDLLCFLGSSNGHRGRQWSTGKSMLLAAARGDFQALSLDLIDHGLGEAGVLLRAVTSAPRFDRGVRLPGGGLTFERTAIVGILNVTPDSFYDGGLYSSTSAAIARAEKLVEEGADIVEIGGVKAGPGGMVGEDEEMRRIVPVIDELRGNSRDLVIAVDTFRPSVAARAVQAGVDLVNDIDGMRNPEMRRVVAESSVGAVIVHIQGQPRVHQPDPRYRSVVGEVTQFLHQQIEICSDEGIARDRIIIDPGPGFGKTSRHDITLMRSLGELRGFPQAVMLAVSRKRFIGDALGQERPEERLEGTLALTAYALTQGIDLVRTHDVAATVQVVQMIDEIGLEARSFSE